MNGFCNPLATEYVLTNGKGVVGMADFPRTLDAQGGRKLAGTRDGRPADLDYRRVGRLEKEDVVIIILSAILVVATLWLASYVL